MKILQEEAKEDGYEEGRAEGRAEGETTGRMKAHFSSIQSIMKNFNLDPVQAMDALNIPEEERDILIKQLNL